MDDDRLIGRNFCDPCSEPSVRNVQRTPDMMGFILSGTTDIQHESIRIFGDERRHFAKFNRRDSGKCTAGRSKSGDGQPAYYLVKAGSNQPPNLFSYLVGGIDD